MHRTPLLELLRRYSPCDTKDERCRERFVEFINSHPSCFERSLAVGHVTGSAWLLNSDGTKALLTHHRKLNRWLQLGGHADGQSDILEVALREAREESGIQDIIVLDHAIFDLDIHPIPELAETPEHDHFDVRFLLQSKADHQLAISDESNDLAWFSASELDALAVDESIGRMRCKWLQMGVSNES